MTTVDINRAAETIQAFLEKYRDRHDWKAQEIRVLPSGDDMDHIKIFLNFPDAGDDELEELKERPLADLAAAHPELAAFDLEVRAAND